MTEDELLTIVKCVRDVEDPSVLDMPVAQTSLDSFDLIVLRSQLENRLRRPISDELWSRAATLRSLLTSLNVEPTS